MSASSPAVRIIRHLPFSAERVFDAWLDPAFAAKWLFATPDGEMIRAEADPRVGGRFTFTERRGGEDVEHAGEYLEITRPSRLVFTFGLPKYSPDLSRVTVEIEPQGNGCLLTLTQVMEPQWAAFRHRSQLGWTTILEGLAAQLGDPQAKINRQSGDDSNPGEMRFVRLLPGPIERVWEYLTDSEKRRQWFTGGPMELRAGGSADLLFRHSLLSPDEEPPEKFREVHEPGVPMTVRVTRCEAPRLLGFTDSLGRVRRRRRNPKSFSSFFRKGMTSGWCSLIANCPAMPSALTSVRAGTFIQRSSTHASPAIHHRRCGLPLNDWMPSIKSAKASPERFLAPHPSTPKHNHDQQRPRKLREYG